MESLMLNGDPLYIFSESQQFAVFSYQKPVTILKEQYRSKET